MDPAQAVANTDAALVERLKAQQESAYEEVVRLYGGRMLAVARRFLQQEQDAQDAVQDAFLSAFKSIDRFEGSAKLSTWLHRIVVNAALMKLRSRQRRPERPIEDLLPKFDPDGHRHGADSWAATIDNTVRDRETREFVRQKINELPDPYRTVLLLRDIEELSTDEAAQQLGITPGAVKTRLHRARLALRELIDGHLTPGKA